MKERSFFFVFAALLSLFYVSCHKDDSNETGKPIWTIRYVFVNDLEKDCSITWEYEYYQGVGYGDFVKKTESKTATIVAGGKYEEGGDAFYDYRLLYMASRVTFSFDGTEAFEIANPDYDPYSQQNWWDLLPNTRHETVSQHPGSFKSTFSMKDVWDLGKSKSINGMINN